MEYSAIVKCQSRLRVTRVAIADLDRSTTFNQFSDHWFVFLSAWKSVWTTLEQGSKSSAKSRQWFGAKKAERKADPVLRYLFAARNDDHHGLDPVLQVVNAEAVFRFPDGPLPPDTEVSYAVEQDDSGPVFKMSRSDGGPIEHVRSREGPFVALQYVKERGNHVVPLPGGEPLEIAQIALDYVVKMVVEAEARCTSLP